jgi:uncharacterized protein YjdB
VETVRTTALQIGFVLLLFNQSACGDSAQASMADVPVDGVKVTPQTLHLEAIGDTGRLVATVSPLDATDRAVTWESTDSGVATVDAQGLVTGTGNGSAVFVTAVTHDGKFQSSANITVGP